MKIKGIIMVIAGLCFFVSGSLSAQEKRPITPQDCVTVRNILPIDETASWAWAVKISPDGGSVAYLVQSPNLQTNINDVDLYVRAVPQDPSAPSRHLLSGKITDFVWSSGGRSLVVLANENGRRVLEIIDVVTAEKQLLIRANTDIEEFTIDKSGDTIVYTTKRESTSGGDHDPTAQDIARGYRIPFGQESESGWPHGSVFLTNRIHGVWTTPRLLEFTSPLSGQRMTSLAYSANEPIQPALSPDGSKLLVVYEDSSTTMPDEWSSSGMKKFLNTTAGTIQAFHLVLMYNITAGETSVPLKSPFVSGRPLWAPDSQSFLIAGAPEVGSAEEKEEVKDGSLGHSSGALLFSVGSEVKKVSIISRRLAYVGEVALHIGKDGSVLARVERESAGTITRFTYQNGEWKQTESFKVPLPLTIASIAVNEHYVIGSFSDLTTPPELFEYQRDNKKVEIFEKLNPQFDRRRAVLLSASFARARS